MIQQLCKFWLLIHCNGKRKTYMSAGETIISPGAKQGLIPLAIPLSKDSSGKKK